MEEVESGVNVEDDFGLGMVSNRPVDDGYEKKIAAERIDFPRERFFTKIIC